jgi:hypothetical protein
MMATEKRKKIRLDVLQELYQFHLVEKGQKAMIPNAVADRNPEKYFALEYLADKRLIRFHAERDFYTAKITTNGILMLKNKQKCAALAAI